jgi:hypothetical protein
MNDASTKSMSTESTRTRYCYGGVDIIAGIDVDSVPGPTATGKSGLQFACGFEAAHVTVLITSIARELARPASSIQLSTRLSTLRDPCRNVDQRM